jgi:hypothetical protein
MFALVGRIGEPTRVFRVSCAEGKAAKAAAIEGNEAPAAVTTVLRRSGDRRLALGEAREFARQLCGSFIGPELDGMRNFALT